MKFQIDKMSCGGCASGVTKAIQSVDPDAVVKVDQEARTVDVSSKRPRDAFLSILEDAGYPAA